MLKILLLLQLMTLSIQQNLLLKLNESKNGNYQNVYSNKQLNIDHFQKKNQYQSCTNTQLFYQYLNLHVLDILNQTNTLIVKNLNNFSLLITNQNIANSDMITIQNPHTSIILSPFQERFISYTYQCPKKQSDLAYILDITLEFNVTEENINFSYVVVCDETFSTYQFDFAQIILITLMIASLYILSNFQEIKGFDLNSFVGFSVKWYTSLIYVLCTIFGFLLTLYDLNKYWAGGIYWFILVVCSFACFFFISEVLALIPERYRIKEAIVCWVRIQDIIATLIALGVVVSYNYLHQPWYISNIISICLLGSLLKIFKFFNMKNSVFFMLICLLTDIAGAIITLILQEENHEFNNFFISQYNSPLEFMLFTISNEQFYKKCIWFSLPGIMNCGLFISYMIRVDKCSLRNQNSGSNVFTIISFMGMIIGSILWLILIAVQTLQLPYTPFCYFFMISLTSIFATKREEIRILWDGSFHDDLREDMAMKGTYKKEATLESYVSDQDLTDFKSKGFDGLDYRESLRRTSVVRYSMMESYRDREIFKNDSSYSSEQSQTQSIVNNSKVKESKRSQAQAQDKKTDMFLIEELSEQSQQSQQKDFDINSDLSGLKKSHNQALKNSNFSFFDKTDSSSN